MKFIGIILICLIIALVAYIRFAPSDPARWHVAPPEAEKDLEGGVVMIVPGNVDLLTRLEAVARATPRSWILAGSVAEGHVTFVTRSRIWGFPDYTTMALRGDMIVIFARLRFGRSDLGVNGKRVRDWLKAAQSLQN